MDRYTEYHCGKAVIGDKSLIGDAMQRLAAYEDAGMTPDEINALLDRDTAKEAKGITGRSCFSFCPSCERTITVWAKFCPECGQRLKRED